MAPLPQPSPEQPDLSIPGSVTKLKDPRRAHRRLHHLPDRLVRALCAGRAGAQDGHQSETCGRQRHDWLRGFLAFPNGIPAPDTCARVFNRLPPQAFPACFRAWVRAVSAVWGIKHIASAGKPRRGSGSAPLGPLPLVSAGAPAPRLSLGPVAVEAQSNASTAIAALRELLDLKGALGTIDAMGCQQDRAATSGAGGGPYARTVTEDQAHLVEAIQAGLGRALDQDFAGVVPETYAARTRGHGRAEYRLSTVRHPTEGIRGHAGWAGLSTLGLCYRERTVAGETTSAARSCIGSTRASVQA